MTEAVDIRMVCRAFRSGTAGLDTLTEALTTTTWYALRPPTPGVLTVDIPRRGRWVLAFSSLQVLETFLAQREDGSVDWLSTSGADLIAHLPPGIGLLIDPNEDHTVALPGSWLRAGTELRNDLERPRPPWSGGDQPP